MGKTKKKRNPKAKPQKTKALPKRKKVKPKYLTQRHFKATIPRSMLKGLGQKTINLGNKKTLTLKFKARSK